VNYQYASKVMQNIFSNYKDYKLKAVKQRSINRGKFSFVAMQKKFDKILSEYLPEFPKEVDLKLSLPKRKKMNNDE
jgi:hypothetical protein